MKILITGICGFIGSHFADHVLTNTDWEIVGLDRMNYASGGFNRLRDSKLYNHKRIKVLTADIILPLSEGVKQEIGEVDYIVHMGAETHVDKSISDPRPFIYSNVIGTFELLEYARTLPNLKKFIYMSTDEVFGPSLNNYAFKEWDRYKSSTPYSASKAGGEELCIAYHNTFNLPTVIIHTMNVYGERQFTEKFIPKMLRQLLQGEEIKIHWEKSSQTYSSRCWIHARNVADAILFLITKGEKGEKYNIVGSLKTNKHLVTLAASTLGKTFKVTNVDAKTVRPGHDLHYILDGTKMRDLGWKSPVDFEQSFTHTVRWFNDNKHWLEL